LIRRARALEYRRQTPIIMFCGSDVEAEARRAGANMCMRKPQDVPALSETIARLLARQFR
jgi:CheY-like chemotaxis protein